MNYKILFILILAITFGVKAQLNNSEETVARVGGSSITTREFLYRYELTPQLFRENKNIKLALKKEFLYSLIAEKLLARYVKEASLDTMQIVRKTIKNFENMFVRDELYKKEIEGKSSERADSLLDVYLSGQSKIQLVYFSLKDKGIAENLYNKFETGLRFDSLFSELPDSLKDTLVIVRGEFNIDTEDKLFRLNEGSISLPISYQQGWYIFKLISGTNPVIEKSEGWETEFNYLKKLAKERAEGEYYKAYMEKFFRNINVKANANLLKSLGKEIYKLMKNKSVEPDSQQKIFLNTYDLLKIKKYLGPDTLSMVYIKFPDEEIILDEFIDFFRFENFFTDSLNYRKVLGILNGKTKKYIEYHLLTAEGYKQGLQHSKEVIDNLNMWRENYYSQLISSEFIDSVNVSNDEMKEYLNVTQNGKHNIKKVNILELVVDSLETAEIVLNKLNEGKNLEDLVKEYSSNKSRENFESGYFPVTFNGEIGSIADKLNIGDVFGPVTYKNAYMIFKLIGVKEDSVKLNGNSDRVDDDAKREFKYWKSREALNRFIANLANEYGFSINEQWLNQISVTSSSSIIYNYLGFGGRILAAPLLNPDMEWVKDWENIQYNP